ncbi:hypothetical protein M728_005890 (plasmid) [Ensifer sp. WSM1721]
MPVSTPLLSLASDTTNGSIEPNPVLPGVAVGGTGGVVSGSPLEGDERLQCTLLWKFGRWCSNRRSEWNTSNLELHAGQFPRERQKPEQVWRAVVASIV